MPSICVGTNCCCGCWDCAFGCCCEHCRLNGAVVDDEIEGDDASEVTDAVSDVTDFWCRWWPIVA